MFMVMSFLKNRNRAGTKAVKRGKLIPHSAHFARIFLSCRALRAAALPAREAQDLYRQGFKEW
jgi:hypothetical protein